MKFLLYKNDYVVYSCPGCKGHHYIPVNGAKKWGFNQDFKKPTLTPSILERSAGYTDQEDPKFNIEPRVCHHFVRDGKIELLTDSTHGVHGVFELPDVNEWAQQSMFDSGEYEKIEK